MCADSICNILFEQEMSTARKKGPGATTKVGGTMRNTAAQFMMKNRDEEFNQMGTYNSQFQAKMKKFSTIADTVAQERFCKLLFLCIYFLSNKTTK